MIDYNNTCLVSHPVSRQSCSMMNALDSDLHDTHSRFHHNKKQLSTKKFYIGDTADEDEEDDRRSIESIESFPGQHWSTQDSDEDDIEPILMTPTQQQDEWCCYALEKESSNSNGDSDNHHIVLLRRCKTRYYQGLSNLAASS